MVDRTAPISRVNTRTFRTVIQRGKIQSLGTYRVALFSYSQGAPCTPKNACVDAVPNRYPLIPLDHEAPSAQITNLEPYANDVSGTLSTPLDFTAGSQTWVRKLLREMGVPTLVANKRSSRPIDLVRM